MYSGTTGRPKGVVKTHAQVEAMITPLVEAWEYAETVRVDRYTPIKACKARRQTDA